MGLLDSFLKDGSILGDLSRLASENPRILQAAASLLSPREGTVGGRGGLGDVLAALQSSGLGDVASSWLSNGANQAIAPDQVSQALGSDTLRDFASAAGVDANEASSVLAGILPELVNQLSPQGQAPDTGSLEGLLGGLLARART